MVVEVETLVSQKDFAKLTLKLMYKQSISAIILFAGIASFVLLLFQWLRYISLFTSDTPFLPVFFVIVTVLYPFLLYGAAQKQYDSNKLLQENFTYTLNDRKIYYVAEGAEGFLDWRYVIKHSVINNFLLLHVSTAQVFIIKIDQLTPEELKFIISNIKTAEK